MGKRTSTTANKNPPVKWNEYGWNGLKVSFPEKFLMDRVFRTEANDTEYGTEIERILKPFEKFKADMQKSYKNRELNKTQPLLDVKLPKDKATNVLNADFLKVAFPQLNQSSFLGIDLPIFIRQADSEGNATRQLLVIVGQDPKRRKDKLENKDKISFGTIFNIAHMLFQPSVGNLYSHETGKVMEINSNTAFFAELLEKYDLYITDFVKSSYFVEVNNNLQSRDLKEVNYTEWFKLLVEELDYLKDENIKCVLPLGSTVYNNICKFAGYSQQLSIKTDKTLDQSKIDNHFQSLLLVGIPHISNQNSSRKDFLEDDDHSNSNYLTEKMASRIIKMLH